MIKHLLICVIILFISLIAVAQKFSEDPFKNLKFSNSPTDTVTITIAYNGMIDTIDRKSQSIINNIKMNGGRVTNNLKHSVIVTFPGYNTKIIAPVANNIELADLKGVTLNTLLNIKCVVYRFYFFDGICNFFYVDKLSVKRS